MAPRTAVVDRLMDLQVQLATTRRAAAPVWEASVASGDWQAMSDARALSETLRVAHLQAKRLTGRLDAIASSLPAAHPEHGRAA